MKNRCYCFLVLLYHLKFVEKVKVKKRDDGNFFWRTKYEIIGLKVEFTGTICFHL